MRPSSCQLHSRTTGLACDPRHDRLPFVFICFHLSPCQKTRGRQIQHLSSLGQRQSGRVQCRGNDECDRARRNCCCPRYHRRKRSKAEGGHGQPVQKLSHSSSAFPIKSHACLPLVRSRIMQPADMGISSRRADTRIAFCMVRSPETVAVSLTSASRRHEQVPGRSPSRGWRPVGHNDIARGSLVLHGGIESAAELRPHEFAGGNRRTSSGSVYGFSAELPVGRFEVLQPEETPGIAFGEIDGSDSVRFYGGPADGMTRDAFEARLAADTQISTTICRAGEASWFVLLATMITEKARIRSSTRRCCSRSITRLSRPSKSLSRPGTNHALQH